jgi:hypothetical protein
LLIPTKNRGSATQIANDGQTLFEFFQFCHGWAFERDAPSPRSVDSKNASLLKSLQ